MRAWRRSTWVLALALLAGCGGGAPAPSSAAQQQGPAPPRAARHPFVVQSPSGDRTDEYYWLRDDTRSRPEVLAYLAEENAYKDALLARLRAAQRTLFDEIVARMPQDDASVPVEENGYWYYRRYVSGGEYPIYARRKGAPDGAEQVLLDGNALAKGHDYFRIGAHEVSADGRLLAWAEDVVGRMQYVIRFEDLETGELYPEQIGNAEASLAWAGDNRSVLYIEKHPETLLGFRVRRHHLGSAPADDAIVYEEKDPSFYLDVWRSRSDRYLHIYASSTVSSEQWVADAGDPELKFRVIVPRARDHEYVAEDFEGRWILRTNHQAPNFRIVEVPMPQVQERAAWKDLVPHPPAGFVDDFAVFRGFLAYAARTDGVSRVHTRSWISGVAITVAVEERASTALLGDNREVDTDLLRFEYTSLTTPNSVYEIAVSTGKRRLLKRDAVLGGFEPGAYESEYLQTPARDGTLIPVSVVYRKDTPHDGRGALYQTGYGAYGSSFDPEFESARLSLLDRGVVFAIAHVRGGQELGRAWYEQGKLLHKQNTFRDFVDVTDFLVARGYAANDRVVARGASAGGLLMGAVATMAPDRYRAIAAHVPFVDVVTTMLDPSIPLTTNEFDEWGNPTQKAYYDAMLAYSPYDNVRAQAYPALLVTTGLWDSQVQYFEPVKWVARLRANKTDARPLILRIDMGAGHGGRSGRFIHQEQVAEEYAFLLDQLGIAVR